MSLEAFRSGSLSFSERERVGRGFFCESGLWRLVHTELGDDCRLLVSTNRSNASEEPDFVGMRITDESLTPPSPFSEKGEGPA